MLEAIVEINPINKAKYLSYVIATYTPNIPPKTSPKTIDFLMFDIIFLLVT